jgi:hypothetical protein
MASILGIAFGMGLIVGGSLMIWRSDGVLGLYNQSGWNYANIFTGDGKVTFVIGVMGFACLVLGAVAKRRVFYGLSVLLSMAAFSFITYELIKLIANTGIVGPGNGIYMVFGGCVPAFMCSLTGYLMLGEQGETLD